MCTRGFGTELLDSTNYHLKIDGQSKRVVQILEGMLQSCVIEFKENWSKHPSLAEFAYNNSYYASIEMALFKALYKRPCRSSMC